MRWIYEAAASAIVKSFKKKRMRENLDIFEWELSQEESDKISKIPQSRLYKAEFYVSENGVYKSLEEF
ncbi:Bifunctional protein STORR [Arachis hypogaea]|uniref:NADP-dependent oxidoreductase domain-containing protein n=1 Tax=Arachis hypogaea TaxID=3818 RepID=A0A445D155_ARAHY|nr:Bifunctional protein STORR [Arachis hypogaea]RYR56937.1 hypothetical protein Ahy_A05g022673 [Arachis hypogaea]